MSFVPPARFMVAVTLVLALGVTPGLCRRIPSHPSHLRFDSLTWQIPAGEPYRRDLGNGLVAYVADDRSLPLVNILGHLRYGSTLDPEGKEGLTSLYAQMLRAGGTRSIPADTLDMLLDLFAINLSFIPSDSRIEFRCSFLSDYTDTALALLQRVLCEPAFENARFLRERDVLRERIRHRFDNPTPVLTAAHGKAMYAGMPVSRLPTLATVDKISRDDVAALHQRIFHRCNVILAASGNFEPETMTRRLDSLVPCFSSDGPTLFPTISCRSDYRIVIVPRNITQAYVRMAVPFLQRPHPDYYACSVLDYILGGGAFSSRLNARVRSDAGLTYDIHSQAVSSYMYPGTFYVQFFTKVSSTVDAIRLVLDEIEKVRRQGVTAEEVEAAKKVLIDGLPSMFRSKKDIVEHYSWNEYYGRSLNHFREYPDSVRAVTPQAVKDMACRYLIPDSLIYVVVADTGALFAADTAATVRLRSLAPLRVVSADSLPFLP